MGVPMVQKQAKRRTSLVLGAVLALLLGVATGFLVLALPVTMLESVTTSIGLSRIMIQAEPPISPNDRTVLAVLAGILASGIGWVLVDWLLFGRVGMSTLIRPREDEYEDDEDSYRPTDPLDLITPVDVMPSVEWPAPAAGDPRRPLSARTDIGDPPFPGASPFAPPLALDQMLPPIDQILPGMMPGAAAVAPAMAPAEPLATASPLGVQSPPAGEEASSGPRMAGASIDVTPIEPSIMTARPDGMPDWLPSPGIRPEPMSEEKAEAAEPEVLPLPERPVAAEAPPVLSPFAPPPPMASPLPPFAPPVISDPMPVESQLSPSPFAGAAQDALPSVPLPSIAPSPFVEPPAAEMPATQAPVMAHPLVAPLPAPAPRAVQPPPVIRPQLPSAGLAGNAPLDRAMIDDLLTRLEKGLRARKANASNALPPVPAQEQIAREPSAPEPLAPPPASHATPPVMAAAPSWPPLSQPIVKRPPPAGFAMNDIPAPPPIYVPPVAAPLQPVEAADGDRMIDQPLHVTLDQLRSMVRR